jgi:hypothetical protein
LGTHRVLWSHNLGTAETVRVEMSFDNGATWTLVIDNAPNATPTSGRYEWVVHGPVTTQARIRVSATGNSAVSDVNDMPFRVNSAIIVTSPNGAGVWAAGSTRTITWNHYYGVAQAFDIDFSSDNGVTWTPLAGNVPASGASTGAYTAVMPSIITSQALVRVSPAGNVANGDASDVPFGLEPPKVTVTAPSTVTVGIATEVKWSHNLGQLEAVDVELSRDGGATWTAIATNVTNTTSTRGLVAWTATGPPTTTGRLRVTWTSNPAVQHVRNVTIR